MNPIHAETCQDCDGTGTFTWYDETADCTCEGNCPCADAVVDFELCDECAKETAA